MPAPSHRPFRDPGRKPTITGAKPEERQLDADVEFDTPAGRGGVWGTAPAPAKETTEESTRSLGFPLTTGQP